MFNLLQSPVREERHYDQHTKRRRILIENRSPSFLPFLKLEEEEVTNEDISWEWMWREKLFKNVFIHLIWNGICHEVSPDPTLVTTWLNGCLAHWIENSGMTTTRYVPDTYQIYGGKQEFHTSRWECTGECNSRNRGFLPVVVNGSTVCALKQVQWITVCRGFMLFITYMICY